MLKAIVHHHHAVLAQKPVLALLAQLGVQPGVVGHRLDAGGLQHAGDSSTAFARLAIDVPASPSCSDWMTQLTGASRRHPTMV
jgi:hypothetical protein